MGKVPIYIHLGVGPEAFVILKVARTVSFSWKASDINDK